MPVLLEQLKIILDKNPIIRTLKGLEIIESPANAERAYVKHAETHMSLGDTDAYLGRMLGALEKNKRVFVGGVSGEYGLGKTSLATFLWRQLEKADVVAVPPFDWTSLDEYFRTVHAWVRYKLRTSPEAVCEVDAIMDRYNTSSADVEIGKLVADGLPREKAEERMADLMRRGMVFDRQVSDLFPFCAALTDVLRRGGYRGLVVFSDELQETVQALGAAKVFSYLFAVANTAQDYEGSFGFYFGMPANTRQQILDSRADVMDRLVNQRLFLDLTSLYSADFARDLWYRYADMFGFRREMADLADDEALAAIGQLTDSSRRDLGNGPRSVVSTFTAIVRHYEKHRLNPRPFTSFDLAEACLSGEILLGENSQWRSKVQKLLADPKCSGYERVLKLLAVFPQGCPEAMLVRYTLDGADERAFIRSLLGEELKEVRDRGYVLYALEARGGAKEPHYERFFKRYATEFSPKEAAADAVNGMAELVESVLFGISTGDWNWQAKGGKTWTQVTPLTVHGTVVGAFREYARTFPNRRLAVTITADPRSVPPKVETGENDTSRYTAHLVILLQRENELRGQTGLLDANEHRYLVAVNVDKVLEGDLFAHKFIERKAATGLFGLALLSAVVEHGGFPEGEKGDVKALLQDLVKELVVTLFSEELLQVKGCDLVLRNYGQQLVRDLFGAICKQRFPEYKTLMASRDWKAKLGKYHAVLAREDLDILARRGQEELLPHTLKGELKKQGSALFGFGSVGPFDSFVVDLGDLVAVDWNKGKFSLQTHRAEKQVLDWLEACPDADKVSVNGTRCAAIPFVEALYRLSEQGYTWEECREVLRFGVGRRYFFLHEKTKQIYRKPVTVHEYKAELDSQADALEARVDELLNWGVEALPVTEKDAAELRARLKAVQSEAEYDRLKTDVNEALGRLNRRLSKMLTEEKDHAALKLSEWGRVLKQQRQVVERWQAPPEGTLPWLGALHDMRTAHAQALEMLGAQQTEAAVSFGALEQPSPVHTEEGLEAFPDYVQTCQEVAKQAVAGLRAVSNWSFETKTVVGWQSVIDAAEESERVLQTLDGAAPETAEKLAALHAHVGEVLAKQSVRSGDPFAADYQALSRAMRSFAARFRLEFDQARGPWQAFLGQVGSDARVRTGFNEFEVGQSYAALYEEVQGHLRVVVAKWAQAAADANTNLSYCQAVLGAPAAEVAPYLANLQEATRLLGEVEQADPVTLDQAGRAQLAERLQQLRKVVFEAVQRVKLLSAPQPVGVDEATLMELLSGSMSLRELILRSAGPSGGMDLEAVLRQVAELFRKNHVDITIARRQP